MTIQTGPRAAPTEPHHVRVSQEAIDLANSWDVRYELTQALQHHGSYLVADLSAVRFMDSSGLGVLVTVLKEARDRGGTLRVINAQPTVARLLQATGMDVLFNWEPGAVTPPEPSTDQPDQPELSHAARRILGLPL